MVKCYEASIDLIEEAGKIFKDRTIDREKLDSFKVLCGYIDMVASEFNGITYDISVDEDTTDICVVLECEEITLEKRNAPLYDAMLRCKAVGFLCGENGYNNVKVRFITDGVWSH